MLPFLTSILRLRLPLIGPLFLCALLLVLGTGSGETFADEPAPLVKVLVTYHSLSGNTERMAEAVVDGVKSISGTEALLKRVGKGDGGRFVLRRCGRGRLAGLLVEHVG
jgi:hypothetical protein